MDKSILRDRWFMTPENDKFASSVSTDDSVKKTIDWHKEVITMDNEFLTVKSVAVRLSVKAVTIYKWLREGKLKGTYFKIGGVYRFKKELLHNIIEGMIEGRE